jgi:four helix bundle protein
MGAISAGAKGTDVLSRTAAYPLCLALMKECWHDAAKLRREPITFRIASQLYRAVGSIAANLAEGYSRRSKHDRARLYEYSLGSAREARVWYLAAEPILGRVTVIDRTGQLDRIARILIAMINAERNTLTSRHPNR